MRTPIYLISSKIVYIGLFSRYIYLLYVFGPCVIALYRSVQYKRHVRLRRTVLVPWVNFGLAAWVYTLAFHTLKMSRECVLGFPILNLTLCRLWLGMGKYLSISSQAARCLSCDRQGFCLRTEGDSVEAVSIDGVSTDKNKQELYPIPQMQVLGKFWSVARGKTFG